MESNSNYPDMISLKQLAKFTSEDWQKEYAAIRQRAARGKYSTYRKIGGEGYISKSEPSLSDEIKAKLFSDNSTLIIQEDISKEETQKELSLEDEKLAKQKAYLLNLYIEYSAKSNSVIDSKHKFINLYNNNAFPELFESIGTITFKTLERWKKVYKESSSDYRSLAPKYNSLRSSSVPPEQAEILIKFALNPNQPLISEVVRNAMDYFTMKNFDRILSAHTYRRFIENWKNEHKADWIFFRKGEAALNDECLPYVERDYDRLNVGDIIVADGHVLNFEIINPFTGKPKRMMLVLFFDMKSSMPLGWEISPTENTQAIAVALRRSIIRLGKMPRIVYMDNGRAFNAKYFTDSEFAEVIPLFERLSIKVITAIPYHGQSKTIERFFRTFSELERMVPTYSGTSIEMQPPRLHRGEKLHNKLYDKIMHGTSINIFQAHQALAIWFDKYSSREQQSGHLKGQTPDSIFQIGKGSGVDKQQLNFLMMSTAVKSINRNGIRMFGTSYWNEALFGKEWNEVIVRYDLIERDSIYVYEQNGTLICEAKKIDKVHPAAGILGTEDDVKLLHEQLTRKQILKNSIVGEAKQFLQNEVYPAVQKQFNEVNLIPINNDLTTSAETIQTEPSSLTKKRRNIVDHWPDAEEKKLKNIDTISKVAEG